MVVGWVNGHGRTLLGIVHIHFWRRTVLEQLLLPFCSATKLKEQVLFILHYRMVSECSEQF